MPNNREIAERETACPKREDRQHCNCWYDGKACCACGDPATEDLEKFEADSGIIRDPVNGWAIRND